MYLISQQQSHLIHHLRAVSDYRLKREPSQIVAMALMEILLFAILILVMVQ
tara:strand:- start:231 stop:383 length:153 start_codon:yes stop_codon:yes gene_type:complete